MQKFSCKKCTYITFRRHAAKLHEEYHNGTKYNAHIARRIWVSIFIFFLWKEGNQTDGSPDGKLLPQPMDTRNTREYNTSALPPFKGGVPSLTVSLRFFVRPWYHSVEPPIGRSMVLHSLIISPCCHLCQVSPLLTILLRHFLFIHTMKTLQLTVNIC